MKALRYSPMVRCLLALLCVGMLCAGLFLLEKGGTVWDVSPDMLTRLSEGTLHSLSSLEEDVHLHLVFKSGSDSSLRQMLETLSASYAREGRVIVDTIDPVTEPGRIRAFAEAGKSIAEGSVIVTNESESRSEVVSAADLYTYQMTSTGSYAITGFSAEQKITGAIRSVTGGERRQVWFLTGHDEAGMAACSQLVSRLQRENYDVDEMSLTQPELLQSGDILLMLSPARDLTDEEAAVLDDFLFRGGRLLLACDASLDMSAMPHVAELATRVSLTFESGIVVEDERQTSYWMNSPLYLLPMIERGTAVLSSLPEGQRVILPGARAISGPEIPLSGYTYEALLTTSDNAYLCPLDSPSIARDSSMPTGKQQLAVSVSHYEEATQAEMRMILLGSLYTAVDNTLMNSTYNLDLTLAMVRYLAQREAEVHVPVRSLTDHSMPALSASESWQVLLVTLALPVLAVLTGTVVLIRRRKK